MAGTGCPQARSASGERVARLATIQHADRTMTFSRESPRRTALVPLAVEPSVEPVYERDAVPLDERDAVKERSRGTPAPRG